MAQLNCPACVRGLAGLLRGGCSMRFRHYLSLGDIAGMWAQDTVAPGDRGRLYRALVDAVCDGAFFEDGLAIAEHSLLGGMHPASVRLPEYQTVHHRQALHAYLGEPTRLLFSRVVISVWAFRNWCPATGRVLPGFVMDLPDPFPADPNHRGPCPLPDVDLISLCEAVTWLTTGRARPAPVLRRLMRRHCGGRWPRGLWREMEETTVKLIAALRRGDIVAYGQLDGGILSKPDGRCHPSER